MPAPLHSEALDALGDANRRAIVEILSGGGRSVQEIADQLPISRPAVSRHLRLLKDAGLVGDEVDGARRIYALRAEGIEAIRQYFASTWGTAVARLRIVAENTTPAAESPTPAAESPTAAAESPTAAAESATAAAERPTAAAESPTSDEH